MYVRVPFLWGRESECAELVGKHNARALLYLFPTYPLVPSVRISHHHEVLARHFVQVALANANRERRPPAWVHTRGKPLQVLVLIRKKIAVGYAAE